MKKYALLGLALLVVACTNLKTISTDLSTKWAGRSYDEFVMEYGVAKANQKLQNGMTVYMLERTGTVAGYQTLSHAVCTLNILVDANNTIRSIKAAGTPDVCNVDI